jgi:Secretion system C-terminal sorting domain
MKELLLILFCFISIFIQAQVTAVVITEVANMPLAISNNPVVEGWANDTGYVYSFGGIDSTKIWSGINKKSFRYNTITDIWDTIPDLPNTNAVIAAGASYVDSMIYIIGGYQVLSSGNEISSNIVNRYDPRTNTYLSDGAPIPIATDDHVQAVWNDSLIYVITGWSNTTNIPNVQIYDPANDNWLVGTSTPNNFTYKAFGASGIIAGNTIYYHGGASTAFNFPGQSNLRIGTINPINPTQITWSFQSTPHITYRAASTFGPANQPHWLGGSEITYNFNGIAYNGSGGVPTKSSNLSTSSGIFDSIPTFGGTLPMDLRGIANMSGINSNPSVKYIAGGMLNGQQVSNKTYKIDITALVSVNDNNKINLFKIYPNPASKQVNITFNEIEERTIYLLDVLGKEILKLKSSEKSNTIDISDYPKGTYIIKIESKDGVDTQKVVLQ